MLRFRMWTNISYLEILVRPPDTTVVNSQEWRFNVLRSVGGAILGVEGHYEPEQAVIKTRDGSFIIRS